MSDPTPKSKQRQTDADIALANADAAALRRLCAEAEEDVKAIMGGLGVMLKYDKTDPRPEHSEQAVEASVGAVKEIALASIELAKLVVTQRANGRDEKGQFTKP